MAKRYCVSRIVVPVKPKYNMKTILTILVLLQLGNITIAQKTKKVYIKNDYPPYNETFYVLKSDKSIKHGLYTKRIRGKIVKQGLFENGVRKGTWEYYDINGDLVHKVDIENKKLIFEKSHSNSSVKKSSKYSRHLIVLGGMVGIYRQIQDLLRYPATARQKGTQGKVFVKLTFNDQGDLINQEVIEGPGGGLDEEAIRTMKLIDFETIPALDLDGNPVQSELILPITFKLG
jgi:protein TonB